MDINFNCSICSESYNIVSDIRATLCGHIFHYDCITSWLERSCSCPQCRKPVAVFNLHRIFLNFDDSDHYRLSSNCNAEDLLRQMEILQIENDSLRIEVQKTTENFKELQVINLSLHDNEINISNCKSTEDQQLQEVLVQNKLLQTQLEESRNEITELKMKNLTLMENLPNARKIIERLQDQLKGLNIEENNNIVSSSALFSHAFDYGKSNKQDQNFHKLGKRNNKPKFKKQLDNLKKSTFTNLKIKNSLQENINADILFGIDSEDEEKVIENLVKQVRINENFPTD